VFKLVTLFLIKKKKRDSEISFSFSDTFFNIYYYPNGFSCLFYQTFLTLLIGQSFIGLKCYVIIGKNEKEKQTHGNFKLFPL
jgi:hypothetical protein